MLSQRLYQTSSWAVLAVTLVLFSISLVNAQQVSPKVKLEVYYETLCPDSIRFLLRQLIPNYSKFNDTIDLYLYPFGKAEIYEYGNSIDFYCQHGPKECRGNAIHSCAFDAVEFKYEQAFPFVECMELDLYGRIRPNVDEVARKCAEKSGLDWKSIEECASGTRGKQLSLESGRKTKAVKPKISFIPTIVINEKYSQENQNKALYGDLSELIQTQLNSG